MNREIADLILRQLTGLLDDGAGAKSYSSVMGPDVLPTDAALYIEAAETIGPEAITDLYLKDHLTALRHDLHHPRHRAGKTTDGYGVHHPGTLRDCTEPECVVFKERLADMRTE